MHSSETFRAMFSKERVAVIPIWGMIGGSVRHVDLLKLIKRARTDATIKAVVLDIDSPGGSAVPSEALYRAVKRLAQTKPVVAWIRGTGASGSYFLACGAWKITAFPGAIVGSIGVISIHPVIVDLLDRIGAQVAITKTGPYKDLGAPWRRQTPEDDAMEGELVQALFRRFTGAVQESRHFDAQQLAIVTTGQVWVAEDAKELGLVDQLLEDEEDACREACSLAKIHRDSPVIHLSTRKNIVQLLSAPASTALRSSMDRWMTEVIGWSSISRLR